VARKLDWQRYRVLLEKVWQLMRLMQSHAEVAFAERLMEKGAKSQKSDT